VNLLPNLIHSFEDTLTLSLVSISNKRIPSLQYRYNASITETSKERQSVQQIKKKRAKGCKAETKVKVKMFIKSVLATTGIEGLYAFEYSNLRENPVVYSRTGKVNYNSSKRSELNLTFTKTNLRQIQNKQPYYRWSYMDLSIKIEPYYQPLNEHDKTLVFESRFESGNLDLAVKASDDEYFLLIQKDTMSNAHTLCKDLLLSVGFYFKVSNTSKDRVVRFHILNFVLFKY